MGKKKDVREEAADRYRLAQAQKLLDLFESAHGRSARTVEELNDWIESPEGRTFVAPHEDADGKIIP